MMLLALVLAVLLVGSIMYCVLTLCAAWRYLSVETPVASSLPPITIMKPLAGLDDGLAENLRSFFDQDYPKFEILLAVSDRDDPAARVARRVMREFPAISSKLAIAGQSPAPNAKVFSLSRMFAMAQHEIVVMADSDTRVEQGFLKAIAAEMSDRKVGLVTCPYRAVSGDSLWSRLEALGLNTEFLAGVLVARMLIGMDFALGPVIAVRRNLLDRIGGLGRLQNYLAEDFVMGNLVAAAGHRVVLSSYKIEHRIGAQNLRANFEHRLRWARSTRRSRPLGYIGQIFTNPVPLALLLLLIAPTWYLLAVAALVFRAITAWVMAAGVLRKPLPFSHWLLMPAQDLISCITWLSGFFGQTIKWRGRRYNVRSDGTFGVAKSEPGLPELSDSVTYS
jgi:ceramide glucosyltransferase